MNAFFESQFSYCPLVWMCHGRVNNGKINILHEHCSVSVHNRSLQILAMEMYKIKNDLSPLIVTELFEKRNEQHCDLRKYSQFTIPPIRTVYQGSEIISVLGPKIWNILPDKLKNANSIEAFKMQIKKWKRENCPCWLCKFFSFFFFNWDSLHARPNSHYKAWSYKKRKHKKIKAYRKSL